MPVYVKFAQKKSTMIKIKHIFWCFVMLLLGYSTVYAQQTREIPTMDEKCGTMIHLEHVKSQSPFIEQNMQQIERFTQQAIRNPRSRAKGLITIPVVVHVLYNNDMENIDDSYIHSQMEQLNEDFRRLNPDRVNTPAIFEAVAADIEIEFCLANVDPNGFETSGITRTYTPMMEFFAIDFMKSDLLGGKDAWRTDYYLNFWICDLVGGLLGYAQFPGGPAETDGIVVDYLFVGRPNLAVDLIPGIPFTEGRTATHEVGHWLNLRHIWGDGDCRLDDFVDDTPLQGRNNGDIAAPCTFPGPNSCIVSQNDQPDMFQNYMDYSGDQCMNLFTLGQKARMRALFGLGGPRALFWNSNGCSGGGKVARCSDGLRNGNEEGVDCGGDCGEECPPRYCTNIGFISLDEWIESVEIGDYKNESGNDFGYGYFVDNPIPLDVDTEYDITLTPGYSFFDYKEYWKVFIDLNKDKDFDDEGELVFDTKEGIEGVVNGTLRIPSGVSGQTRMRVVMKFTDPDFGDPFEPLACGSESFESVVLFGEVEDYTVDFGECKAPNTHSATVFNNGSAIISWDHVPGVTNYQLRYTNRNGQWRTKHTTSNRVRLTNLVAGYYTYQIAAICESGIRKLSNPGHFNLLYGRGRNSDLVLSEDNNILEDLEDRSTLKVFPNPVTSELTVKYSLPKTNAASIQVKDILGRTLLIQPIAPTGKPQTLRLPVDQLESGIYYINLADGKNQITKKFVKK